MNQQQKKAQQFLSLHHSPEVLALPNAWDVASVKIFAHGGFKAVGTTSAGIAASLGFADGQEMGLQDNLAVVERIVTNTDLPVSADMESGYATTVDGVVNTAVEVLRTGAVGLNLEDSGGDPQTPLIDMNEQSEKINAIRLMSEAQKVHLVINARTDAFLVGEGGIECLRSAIERGNSYREAGADCIFVPDVGTLDALTITTLVKEIDAPVNIIAGENTPPLSELQEIGVARVSFGPRPMRALLSLLREIAHELNTTGTYELMSKSSISYDEVNQWFKRP